CREVAYITLSSFRVNPIFQKFSLSTRRPVSRCSVSMEAHYREFSAGRNRKFAEKSLTAAFPSKTPPYTLLRTDLSTRPGKSEKFASVAQTFSLKCSR
ncbi:hypothetical protein, partial [uncultured Pluralibacter sp.]|uniref:hypothetical protein n=1 Tax=uncultured Pluralibacter sp. TaxID=1490864 RepID=UPI0026373FA5